MGCISGDTGRCFHEVVVLVTLRAIRSAKIVKDNYNDSPLPLATPEVRTTKLTVTEFACKTYGLH